MDKIRTVLILEHPSRSRSWFERIFAGKTRWRVLFVAGIPEMLTGLDDFQDALVLVPGGDKYDAELKGIVAQVSRRSLRSPVVYLADEPHDCEQTSRALRAGVNDFVFASVLEQPAGLEILRLAWLRQELSAQKEGETNELLQCKQNLELLDVLAVAVTSTIDHDELLHRAMKVFASICPHGRSAYYELVPTQAAGENGESVPAAASMQLRCAGSLIHTEPSISQPVSLEDSKVLHAPYRESEEALVSLIMENKIQANILAPDRRYPLLRTLWNDMSAGQVSLVPVWSSVQPLGLLIIYSRAQDRCSRLFMGEEPLRVMARIFGATLQNAQLYEEVDAAYQTLQSTQSQLVHSEKFAAMGVLSAEIAHEFNNPASFVISNLSVMREYVEMISGFVEGLSVVASREPSVQAEIEALEAHFEIAFLREDLENLISRSLSGMQRIHQIVQDLRYFSHDVAQEPGWVDLEQLVSAVLHLVSHEARYRARLELDFSGLPQVFSDANKLSQVLLNLFVNAAHSIAPGNPEENFIRVSTRRDGEDVILSVQDSGVGIAPDVLPKIFDPFFTTKERGSATGLGLSIVQDILRGLGGELKVSSELGVGSVFEFRLPIRAAQFAVKKELRESGSYKSPPRSRRTTPVYRSTGGITSNEEKPDKPQEPT